MANTTPVFPVIRTPQGALSPTWAGPPFDVPHTIPDLYAFNASRSPDHPAFVYASGEEGVVTTLYHRDVAAAIQLTAHTVVARVGPLSRPSETVRPVVAILAILDSISYVTLTQAILRAGFVAFPISTRNSPAAVAHLLRVADVQAVFVSGDAGMRRLVGEAIEQFEGKGEVFKVVDIPTFEEMYVVSKGNAEEAIQWEEAGVDETALILHSSGYADTDLCGMRISVHALPMFHVMGLIATTMMLGTGATLAVFPPVTPPIVPTSESVLQGAVASKADGMMIVPAFLEAWARDPDALPALQSLKFILFAGAPLNKGVGDDLVRRGVRIRNAYGMTEVGAPGQSSRTSHVEGAPPETPCEDWEYIMLADCVKAHRAYVDGTPGVFELIIVDSPTWSPCVINTEIEGTKAYATNDLMEEHPRDPRLFKIYGRADDQIILSTGEKTNPVPMEALITQHPAVAAAIMFGRGRFQNGVLIQPLTPFDPSNESELEAFRNVIWPTVERANKLAPAHSRIFKEMITTTHSAKLFPLTAKGTPRRQVALDAYATEIDALYARVEASATQVDVPPPAVWDADAVRAYVRAVVLAVMQVEEIDDGDDLFQQGCDSLQATYIRNALMHALRTSAKVSTHAVPTNFVYTHPSIAALSTFILRILSGGAVDAESERAARVDDMQALLKKYTQDFAAPRWKTGEQLPQADKNGIDRETVLITGSTGRLGSHLLAQLLSRNDVRKVYALNRGTRGRERQVEAFGTWKLDESLLKADRVVFWGADLAKKDLGLVEGPYEELRSSVTMIIHNAWRVDFNVSLTSFEPLIAGARNLLDLSLASSVPGGPKIVFVSSISALFNYASPEPAQETLASGPELAVGLGYGESKWVTEQLLGHAATATGLRATVARVGQLCGDTRAGGWGTKEWVPALARASKVLGGVPNKDDTVAWVPVDIAASTILDVLRAPSPESVIHLTAPKSVSWEAVVAPMAARLAVPLIPAEEWVARYKREVEAGAQESAFQLLDFFEAFVKGREVQFSTERAEAASVALKGMKELGAEDVGKWLEFWAGVGFLDA